MLASKYGCISETEIIFRVLGILNGMMKLGKMIDRYKKVVEE